MGGTTVARDREEGRGPVRALLERVRATASSSSLAVRFLVVGGVVSLIAMAVVGAIVTSLIEKAVTRNAATMTALYVDSVIAPLLPDMRTAAALDDVVRRALDETLDQGALGGRVAEMRLWSLDGTILYARDATLIGGRHPVTPSLSQAFEGSIVARYGSLDPLGRVAAAPDEPLLEIYNPVLQPWSGDVIAVIEF